MSQELIDSLEKKFDKEIEKANLHIAKAESLREEMRALNTGLEKELEQVKCLNSPEVIKDGLFAGVEELGVCSQDAVCISRSAKIDLYNYINGYNNGVAQEVTEDIRKKDEVTLMHLDIVREQSLNSSAYMFAMLGHPAKEDNYE